MADTVELDNLSPTRKAESLGDAQTELRAEIEDGWTAGEGRASDQYRFHTDQVAAESPPRTDGKTDVEFEEGWMAQGGRAGNSREIGPESGADEETDIELEESRAADGGRAGEGSEDGPKSSTQDGLRTQSDGGHAGDKRNKTLESFSAEEEYDTGTLKRTRFQAGFFPSLSLVNERSEDGPKSSTQDGLRIQPDDSEKPHISLCQAVKDNNTEAVKEWLKYNKKRVKFRDKHGYAPVHYAAKLNRLEVLKLLHEQGKADITVKTVSEEYTPLHLAAHFKPPRTRQESVENDRVETDGSNVEGTTEANRNLTSNTMIEYLLEKCKGVDAHVNARDSYGITPLHMACQAGNLHGVEVLLKERNIDINAQDSNGDTPLHAACLHGHGEHIVEQLLKFEPAKGTGNKIKLRLVKNHSGHTPFHLACREGHKVVAKQLLEFVEQPSRLVKEKDKEGATALHIACQRDEHEIVEFLLEKKADISARKNDGMTPVHVAAEYGCLGVMRVFLKKPGFNIDIKDAYSQTPLHFATEYGETKMMELLLDNGADPKAEDIDGYTPLLTAAEFGHQEAFECLKKKDGVQMTALNKEKKSVLYLAAQSNHPEIVKIVLKNEEGQKLLLVPDTNLNLPLHAAATKGHVDPLERILEHCTREDVNAENISRKTAMHLAAENGHTDVVEKLVEKCSESAIDMIRSMDEDGNTPLHLACCHGYEEVALYLINNQADIGARNEVLWTPLDCAASKGHTRVIERLVNFKADIDPKDKQKTTPLHLAAKAGHVSAVETLIKHGALVSSRDCRGFNALDWAIENGHSNVAEVIINSRKWKFALKNHITMPDGTETTPFRKLIQRMPDVAELVLRKCTASNAKDRNVQPDSEDYTVTFDYEFIEDKDHAQMWEDDVERSASTLKCGVETQKEKSTWRRLKEKSLRLWGHSKLTHPLRIMVKSQRTELLKHPLMYHLIEYKWKEFGRALFYSLLVLHILLVIFLTAFALRLLNPFSPTCTAVSSGLFNHFQAEDHFSVDLSQLEAPNDALVTDYLTNENINGTAYLDEQYLCLGNITEPVRDAIDSVYPIDPICGKCGLSTDDTNFITAAAIIIIIYSCVRLILEIVRFVRQLHIFFADFDTWVEVPLFISAIIFTAVFNRECLCPRDWQWQIGIGAVFLVWIDLIIYMRRMRVLDTGIYVLMFEAIFKTFLKVIILTVLLIVTFALTFYMAFNQFVPRFARSPFASPFTSIWKTMTMAIGSLDYDNIFRQSTSDSMSTAPDVPFPAISYIMWVIFIILMPVLFTNLLVGLAVDDIKGILDAAALTRLALRVDLVLGIEDYFWFLPWIRNHMNEKRLKVKPYKGQVQRLIAPIMRLLRGENYSSAQHIANMLNPVKTPNEQQTQALIHEMAKLQQQTQQEMAKMHETLQTLSRVVQGSIHKSSGGGHDQSMDEYRLYH